LERRYRGTITTTNNEKRDYADSLDILMALSRTKDGQKTRCFRVVAKDYERDLQLLETKCKLEGGKWRIHKTVNKRDTEKARIWLIHKLIDFPEGAGFIDSLWRTALLQRSCIYGDKKFLLDIDTEYLTDLYDVEKAIWDSGGTIDYKVKTENGFHIITEPFDTRKVCLLDNVSLLRDGYVYIKTVGEKQ